MHRLIGSRKKEGDMTLKAHFLIILIVLLLNGCATRRESKDGLRVHTAPKIYKFDLDCDGQKEIIKVEDNFDKNGESMITVIKKDKSKIDSVSFPARFINMEFIDLNVDGNKQIAVYSQEKNKCNSLIIYKFNNNRLLKIFSAENNYGIDTSFGSFLSRIKVAKLKSTGDNSSSSNMLEWESWVWSGERFIRE